MLFRLSIVLAPCIHNWVTYLRSIINITHHITQYRCAYDLANRAPIVVKIYFHLDLMCAGRTILTYFWDERNDTHVDPKAPFPPYTKTLPADIVTTRKQRKPKNVWEKLIPLSIERLRLHDLTTSVRACKYVATVLRAHTWKSLGMVSYRATGPAYI